MPLGEKAWEGDPSRLVSPDTGLRATRRKCRGEADTECSTRLVITFVHLVSFLLRAVPIFVRRLAGTLVGQNTTGGAINYIVAKPTDTFSAGADASVGNFSTFDVAGFVSGPLASNVKARLAVRTLQSGPWQYSYTRNDELGKKNLFQGRFIVDIEASERLKLSFNLNGWRDRGDTQAAQLQSDNCAGSTAGTCGSPDAFAFRDYPRAPQNARAADWGYGIFGVVSHGVV